MQTTFDFDWKKLKYWIAVSMCHGLVLFIAFTSLRVPSADVQKKSATQSIKVSLISLEKKIEQQLEPSVDSLEKQQKQSPATATVCTTGDEWCLDGEQYVGSRFLYPAKTINDDYTNYAIYLQDSMTWGRLELTPGVRVSMDDFLGNLNIAPRFAISYDVFGDRSSRIFAGANRYYAGNILAYKLRDGIGERYSQTRSSASANWVTTGPTTLTANRYTMSELDTPFSDELNIGIAQRVWDTIWTLKYVHRNGRDQFSRTSETIEGVTYRVMDNSGRTKGETVSLTIEPISPFKFKYGTVDWEIGANYSNNKSSSNNWNTAAYDDNPTYSKVIYKDELLDLDDAPAWDFGTPWNAFLRIDTTIPKWHLNWTQRLGYTAGYRGYTTSTIACSSSYSACGDYTGSATLYEEKQYDDYFSYDWRFNWSYPVGKYQSLAVSLDVLNVFDTTIETAKSGTTSTAPVSYKTGRQFWLGLSYNW
ncbi:TonB-dependent receptor [Acinetobacter qingfengensis]|nr:TonB-dependent receptor [Acinetobacter qingfengensis]